MDSHALGRKKSGAAAALLVVVVLLTSGFAIPIGIAVHRPAPARSAGVVKRCNQDVQTAERSNRSTSNDERGDRIQSIFRLLL